jgi:formate hydrogenlyase transcriptional activator
VLCFALMRPKSMGRDYPSSERLNALIDLTEAIVRERHLPELFRRLAELLHRVVDFEAVYVTLYEPDEDVMRLCLLEMKQPAAVLAGAAFPASKVPGGLVMETQQALVVDELDAEKRFALAFDIFRVHGLHSACLVPLTSAHRRLGVLGFGSPKPRHFKPEDVAFIQLVARQVAVAVDNALAYGQIEELKGRLEEEKLYLEEEIRADHNFKDIIGTSTVVQRMLKNVEMVAGFNSTVLIRGETGTGKELVARAIHDSSSRRQKTFVKVNCAAVPAGLVESELFGHERGAFTGAIAQRIGRFELANHGTLFLDEVGDIPLEVQPKLLRVLQDQHFERLGSNRTIHSNARLVAATSRNLEKMVADREFRQDLYYRLSVFPIRVPSLRERREDVPQLVRHFVQKCASRMNRKIRSIPARTMEAMVAWHWPGNVRELENFIERAVILSTGAVLDAPLGELDLKGGNARSTAVDVVTRELILKALRDSGWVVGGASGAAARLGMKRTSLQSKMKQLGIARPKSV